MNLWGVQWMEQRTICYFRPKWQFHLWFDWREGTWLAQGRAVGTVPHQVQAGAARSPRQGLYVWWQGLLLVSEKLACSGSDSLGCVQHAAPPLHGNGMSVQQWWLSHCPCSHGWVLCSEAQGAACTSWFTFVTVTLTSTLVGYVPVLIFRVQSRDAGQEWGGAPLALKQCSRWDFARELLMENRVLEQLM